MVSAIFVDGECYESGTLNCKIIYTDSSQAIEFEYFSCCVTLLKCACKEIMACCNRQT